MDNFPQQVSKIILNDLKGLMNRHKVGWKDCPIPPEHLSYLVQLKESGAISHNTLKVALGLYFD